MGVGLTSQVSKFELLCYRSIPINMFLKTVVHLVFVETSRIVIVRRHWSHASTV